MLPIFVSSTFVDLEDHRASVREIIRQIGAVDVAMEHLGARDERPKDECVRLIRTESKAFIGIYAHRGTATFPKATLALLLSRSMMLHRLSV